jgi:4-hydroxy-tetrahydrodipicolinate synthase
MEHEKGLHGVIPAVLTPYDGEGNIDTRALAEQTAYLSSAGVHGFFIGGTTAEGAFLRREQKRVVFETIRGVVEDMQFLCLACIRPSTRQVLEEMRELADLKPDYFVAVTPFYETVGQDAIRSHFEEVARQSTAPLLLYNIPSRTGNPMSYDTITQLLAVENVAGIKDSSGDFTILARGLLEDVGRPFAWIQGEDYLDAVSLLLGGQGIVTGLGNIHIEPYVEMYAAAEREDTDTVKACQRRINRMYGVIHACPGKAVSAIKTATFFFGRGSPRPHLSSMDLTEEERRRVEDVLKGLD